jgi:hypothetical protein
MNRIKMLIGTAAALHITAFVLMLFQVEPFYTFFYSLSWWTYILLIAGINHLKNRNSLLFDSPREFLWLFFYSTLVWLFFEIYNFRLNNWHYLGVPAEAFIRWPGYFIAFGTVLPGLFETHTFLRNLGVIRYLRSRPIRLTNALLTRSIILGVLMMLAPLIQPTLFFPLVWLGLIFILDPIVYWKDSPDASILGRAAQGNYGLLARLLLTGLICGLLWEFWNYWAGSKWVYSVPLFDFFPVFEMPILGYLGFPPFVIECYLLYRVSLIFRRRYLFARLWAPILTAALVLVYCVLVFIGIDRLNILTFRAIL